MSSYAAKLNGKWAMLPATLLLALFLNVIPYPKWAELVHPDWVTLALFYWCLVIPRWFGVGYGWLLGLLLDLLQYTLFGQHALGKAFIALVVVNVYPRLRQYTIWQQCMVIAVLASVDIGIVVWISHSTDDVVVRWQYWWAALSTALLWPIAYVVLSYLRQRSGIRQQ